MNTDLAAFRDFKLDTYKKEACEHEQGCTDPKWGGRGNVVTGRACEQRPKDAHQTTQRRAHTAHLACPTETLE